MSAANIKTVEKIYEAFRRGDVETILDQCADDVDWASEADDTTAPWHGVHKGKGEVPKFFEGVASALEVTDFTQLSIAANDTDVHSVVRFGWKSMATGKQATMNIHHWWTFDKAGKITLYRGTEDTELILETLRTG